MKKANGGKKKRPKERDVKADFICLFQIEFVKHKNMSNIIVVYFR